MSSKDGEEDDVVNVTQLGQEVDFPALLSSSHDNLQIKLCNNQFPLFANFLSQSTLTRLCLANNQLRGIELKLLTRQLPSCITELDISSNTFGDSGFKELCTWFISSNLRTINLSACELTDDAVFLFASQLNRVGALRKVDFSWNSIGDLGAAALAEAVEMNPHQLFSVDFSFTKVDNDGTEALYNALQTTTTTMHYLGLEGNWIDDDLLEAVDEITKTARVRMNLLAMRSAQEATRVGQRSALRRIPRELTRLVSLHLF